MGDRKDRPDSEDDRDSAFDESPSYSPENEDLAASYTAIDRHARDRVALLGLASRFGDTLGTLERTLRDLPDESTVGSALQALQETRASLAPILSGYLRPQDRAPQVLLAEPHPRRRSLARVSLRGLGLEMDVARNMDEGRAALDRHRYDVICFGESLLELGVEAHARDRARNFVLFAPESIDRVLPLAAQHPFLNSVVARYDISQALTVLNISTTVQKLATGRVFGVEKYLGWGTRITELLVPTSSERGAALRTMKNNLASAGIRGQMRQRAGLIGEELLMNAIYDAPRDDAGNPLYNHLPRSEPVKLTPEHAPILRWGFDGAVLAVSVEDPFGALTRTVTIDYLKGCFEGQIGRMNEGKSSAGAGLGLFQVLGSSDVMIINADTGTRTEIISILDLHSREHARAGSLHFFFVGPQT